MRPLFISWHRNPDTDTIAGAICYADLKHRKGETNAVACRLGEVNAESRFVLDRFGLEEPMLLKSVKVQVSDLDMDKAFCVKSGDCIEEALDIMHKEHIASMFVTDEDGKLEGVITFGDIAKAELEGESTLDTTVEGVAKAVRGSVVCGSGSVKGKVSILSGDDDLKNASGIVITAYKSGAEADAAV
ncbi:MAG: CBS domain-containing protein, partial [Clostridia bacterium]|nr:CBS domain-containing protein [Clostridia bacterium]